MQPLLSIVVPGIRRRNWGELVASAYRACKNFTFQIIFVGPNEPDITVSGGSFLCNDNVEFIRDYGCPARCTQLGIKSAKGQLITWASDDGVFLEDSLDAAISLYFSSDNSQNEMVMRYLEGENFSGNHPPEYWNVSYHNSLRMSGIPQHYKIAPLGMLTKDLFLQLGGFDCRFEHINMCCHDLSFRLQCQGGQLLLSPTSVLSCDKEPYQHDSPVERAYRENDLPLFESIYNNPQALNNRVVEFDNWERVESRWGRRYA